jgi:hypothetical protein
MVESKETARDVEGILRDWKGNRRLEHGICTGEHGEQRRYF